MSLPLDQIGSLPKAEQEAILDGPALNPPPGIVPNFENPPNQNAIGYAATTICLVAAFLGILVRTYGRFFCVRKGLVEDYLAIAAFGLYIGYIYVTYWLLDIIGFYVHQWDIRVRDFTTLLYIVHIGSNCYSVTMMIMKTSILRDWCRIFVPYGVRNGFFYICHLVMGLNIGFYTAVIFAENLSSFPHKRIWDLTVPGTTNVDIKGITVAAATINIVLDIITLILPQRIIWSLQMPKKRKIGVSLVFTVGILACISAVARLAYSTRYYTSDDTAYTLSSMSLWAIAEMTCMFLIFGGTVLPKIFTSSNLMSTLFAKVKTWYSSYISSTRNTTTPSLPHGGSEDQKYRNVYLKLDENSTPLTDLSAKAEPRSESQEELRNRSNMESGITRTTQITTEEEYIVNDGTRLQSDSNRAPWV
ncbi:hypothetical protein F5Y11DRAFT_310539 [Daldinia sp. FL1419]|nr:hypothetical protein F5Y11DRAFT_310539 [Daldinia sp. FL1419]